VPEDLRYLMKKKGAWMNPPESGLKHLTIDQKPFWQLMTS